MTSFYQNRCKFLALLLTLIVYSAEAQQLRIKDFAVWGGSASATTYNDKQGVFISSKVVIKGTVGSNHRVDAATGISINGNIFSGNKIALSTLTAVNGDINAGKKSANVSGPLVSLGNLTLLKGNLTSFGKVEIKVNQGPLGAMVTGRVSVPAPTSGFYSGPAPKGGFSNAPTFPLLPVMPNNTPFDNKAGTTDVTTSKPLSPGAYQTMALKGNQTITIGVGNYIFKNINNTGINKIVFNFNGDTTGTINIYVVNDANWGKVEAKMINGYAPSKIYTEVHGKGLLNNGYAFDVSDGSPKNAGAGSFNWIGSVWAPNGGINIRTAGATRQNGFLNIIGALWSATRVNLENGIILSYQSPRIEQNFIDPYYPPPATGKVESANNIIGAELFSLFQNPSSISSVSDNSIFQIDDNKVMIEVISKEPNDITLQSELVAAGMTDLIDNGPHTYVITGSFWIRDLQTLNNNNRIRYVRPLYLPITNAGQVTSQGDVTMRSDKVRERFGLNGEGIKIGVLSDSYDTRLGAQTDVDEGDLPGVKSDGQPNDNAEPVQVLGDYPGQRTDEGRAMLQIIRDVCPDCKVAFRTGFLSAGDFANSIKQLADPALEGGKCDIIVDDVTYITEPFLRDGVVAKTVDEVVAQGVSYFTSAGNFGERSYEGLFRGVSNNVVIPSPATIHRFGSSNAEVYQTLRLKPGKYTIVLQWADEFHSLGSQQGVQTDLDLYLLNSTGFTLFGFNRSNLLGDPFEICPFVVREETEAKLMVVNATGNNTNVRFKYIIFAGDGTIVNYQSGSSTIVGHANAEGAITVGAMLYANIPPFTPVYPGVASFSSRGGTNTLTASNTYVARSKPNIIGPNGANITFALNSNVFNDGDRYYNFFGTSAAAPHVAAAAALMMQAKRKYDLQAVITPAELRNMLQNYAGKFPGQTNHSFVNGFGFVQADLPIGQIANARPIISSWEPVIPGTQPGILPFRIKVKGEYLTDSSLVYFNGAPLGPVNVSPDKTEVTAVIPAIIPGEDPPLQLFNTAKSPSGLDGGLSEALHFFSSRVDVTIRARSESRKYKQQNPAFTADVFVNGVPIDQTSVTLADLKLDGNIAFSTLASTASDVGSYSINPSRKIPLDPNDTLSRAYGFTFVKGTLTIDKMPLKITPRNQTIKYGNFPDEIAFDYEFDQSQPNDQGLLDQVKGLHKRYMADNALVVLHGYNSDLPGLSDTDLNNLSIMTSFQAVRNARTYSVNNGQLRPVVNTISVTDIGEQKFVIDVAAQSFSKYKSDSSETVMVNALPGEHARGLLNIKTLSDGSGKAAVPNGRLQPMVNGQLMAMVNGQLQALVNGQLRAIVNEVTIVAEDIIFQNGQLLALVNGEWVVATNGQLRAVVNGEVVTVELSIVSGQLRAVVNGQLMALVNGQLRAVVNGQLLAIVNGQLKGMVNGQLLPVVNGQLVAIVNGQLQPVVNGQLLALVNGQLMAIVNGELEVVQSLTIVNGQLQAIVNGQLRAVVNGQLKAMVNGVITDVPNPTIVNGQLQAVVNGQLQAIVNGQLQAIVNGQLRPIVNGSFIPVSGVRQLANGQLRAVVNGVNVPLTNGQLQAVVNGQLLAMVNGQLMAVVNGELTFAAMQNGQLKAVVNGQLQPVVNGQLRAVVNNQVMTVDSYSITNGQLRAVVNGELMALVNNQLLAFSNGQLQPVVNNFEAGQTNANIPVLIDEDDINLQGGAIGGMFAVNMVTGLNAGMHTIIPGAFLHNNFDVTFGKGQLEVLPGLLAIKANDTVKVYGEQNPAFTTTVSGLSYNDDLEDITEPEVSAVANSASGAGRYPVVLSGGSAANYSLILQNGVMNISKKDLTVTADNKTKTAGEPNPPLTISYTGLTNGDTKDDICTPVRPKLPKAVHQLERTSTYTNVSLNSSSNKLFVTPGSTVTLTADWSSIIDQGELFCSGCITQHYIGIAGVFSDCHDVSGPFPLSGTINRTFAAPATPGVYYITQVASWEFACFNRGSGLNFDNNNAADAIAVLIVGNERTGDSIIATTTAGPTSPIGFYPITLSGCSSANYEVTYVNGTLSVGGSSQRKAASRGGTVTLQEEIVRKQQEENLGKSYLAPNPATNSIKVQLSNEGVSVGDFVVIDGLGRLQQIKNIKKISGRLFEMDISILPKGVYFIKVKTSGNKETFRFLKL